MEVPGRYTLGSLHQVLQIAMGWTNSHLHVFEVGGIRYSDPTFEMDEYGDEVRDEGRTTLAEVAPMTGASMQYEYDFGDGWEHEVTLEAILPRQKGVRYPRCLAGERACPPEDCGGVGGYEDLMAVMRDPTHEEYERTLQWLGGRFDPERFNPKTVKFDHPGKRWNLAFGKTVQSRRRGARRTSRRTGPK